MATRLLSTQRVVNLPSDPATGTAGELYYNTASNVFKYYNGTSWAEIVGGSEGASLTVSETAPSPASEGDLWLNSSTLKLLVYYDSFWVEIGGGGGSSGLPDQTGNSGKYLTTNGSDASWATVSPTITLAGDLTGNATLTNLGNATLTATIAANSVELGTDTVGQYIAAVSGTANQINVSGSGTESITLTLSTPQNIHTGATPTFAGATFTGTVVLPAATASIAPLRIPHGIAPTAPTNGDIWTTTAGIFARINGSTVGPLGAGGGGGAAVAYQNDAPTSPSIGDVWVDSDESVIYLSTNDFATKSSPAFTGAATFNDGTNIEGRLTAASGVFYIQAGINSSDTSAVLNISRNSTTTTNISQFNVYANNTLFNGTISASEPSASTHLTTKSYVDSNFVGSLLFGGM